MGAVSMSYAERGHQLVPQIGLQRGRERLLWALCDMSMALSAIVCGLCGDSMSMGVM